MVPLPQGGSLYPSLSPSSSGVHTGGYAGGRTQQAARVGARPIAAAGSLYPLSSSSSGVHAAVPPPWRGRCTSPSLSGVHAGGCAGGPVALVGSLYPSSSSSGVRTTVARVGAPVTAAGRCTSPSSLSGVHAGGCAGVPSPRRGVVPPCRGAHGMHEGGLVAAAGLLYLAVMAERPILS